MLDQQDRRAVAADVVEQALERRGLGRVHAGRRLVEREQLRLGRERARDLEPALVAVGEMLGERVGALRDADVLEQLVARFSIAFSSARVFASREDRAEHVGVRAHVAADHHVLERRQVREQADVLERARDAARGDLVRLQAGERQAVEHELAAVRPRRCRSAR